MKRLLRTPQEILDELERVFGHRSFRPAQAEVIRRVLLDRDVLALMPTGAGKSICYQLPAALLPGVTVVISPLIALMKDQLESLPPVLAGRATSISSALTGDERRERLRRLENGEYKLVYASPERLRQQPFLHALRCAGVSLFVVDEAHCVSLWGHDFRPDYLFVKDVLGYLGQPPLLAVTATAAPPMVEDISRQLERPLEVVRLGGMRENLRFEVRPLAEGTKYRALREVLAGNRPPAIVYVSSRGRAAEVADRLTADGWPAGAYHAGLAPEERDAAQDAFFRGEPPTLVATSAFGLGVDKEDIRLVVHYDLPPSLECLVQEAGRAGRDGRLARCVVFATEHDRRSLARWREAALPDVELTERLADAVEARASAGLLALPVDDLLRPLIADDEAADDPAADATTVRVGLSLLEKAGFLKRHFDLPRGVGLRVHRLAEAPDELRAFVERARLRVGQWRSLDFAELVERSGVGHLDLEGKLLEWRSAGLIAYRGAARDLAIEPMPRPHDLAERLEAVVYDLSRSEMWRLDHLFAYLSTRECRQRYIADYFAVDAPSRCGACDNCLPKP